MMMQQVIPESVISIQSFCRQMPNSPIKDSAPAAPSMTIPATSLCLLSRVTFFHLLSSQILAIYFSLID